MRESTFTLVYWGFIPSFPTKGQLVSSLSLSLNIYIYNIYIYIIHNNERYIVRQHVSPCTVYYHDEIGTLPPPDFALSIFEVRTALSVPGDSLVAAMQTKRRSSECWHGRKKGTIVFPQPVFNP